MAENKDICFCHEPISGDVVILRCLHKFHSECIRKWLRTKRSCPWERDDVGNEVLLNGKEVETDEFCGK